MNKNTKQNQHAVAQSRPERLSTENKSPLPKINFTLRRANRRLETESLLSLLKSETTGFFELAEVVGKWVWISFPEKQSPNVTMALSELGFHWNNLRQVWQQG